MGLTPIDGYTIEVPGVGDAPAVAELIASCARALGSDPPYTPELLLAEWQEPRFQLAEDARKVVGVNGELVGYTAVLGRDAEGYVHPEHTGRGIGARLVHLTERRALKDLATGESATLRNWALGPNEAAERLLEGAGYRLGRVDLRMVIEMDAPPEQPQWPEGVSVRAVEPGRDERLAYGVYRESWGTGETFDEWSRRFLEHHNYDPRLWFLAARGEEVVGALWAEHPPDMGWIRQLVVLPAQRGCGIGMGLLRHAFAEFYKRGERAQRERRGQAVRARRYAGRSPLPPL